VTDTHGLPEGISQDRADMINACMALIVRISAQAVQIRYCDEDTPIIWLCVDEWKLKNSASEEKIRHDVASALDPLTALMRLCESDLDGGQCTHCGRPVSVTFDHINALGMPSVCEYTYDPELKTFRRDCE